jgi:hypothetical protein
MQGTKGRRHDVTAQLGCAGEEDLLGNDAVQARRWTGSKWSMAQGPQIPEAPKFQPSVVTFQPSSQQATSPKSLDQASSSRRVVRVSQKKQQSVSVDLSSESHRDRFVSLGSRRAGVRRALPHLDLVLAGVPPSPVLISPLDDSRLIGDILAPGPGCWFAEVQA